MWSCVLLSRLTKVYRHNGKAPNTIGEIGRGNIKNRFCMILDLQNKSEGSASRCKAEVVSPGVRMSWACQALRKARCK